MLLIATGLQLKPQQLRVPDFDNYYWASTPLEDFIVHVSSGAPSSQLIFENKFQVPVIFKKVCAPTTVSWYWRAPSGLVRISLSLRPAAYSQLVR
jgi:hypothetical protein